MKIPHRLLQIGTLTLFSSMIGGLVLFQSGTFAPKRPVIEQDSLPPKASVDSAKLPSAILDVKKSQFHSRMYSSKVGLTFRADNFYEEAMRDSSMKGLDDFERGYRLQELQIELAKKDFLKKVTREDTLRAFQVLRMRQELASLSFPEAIEFQINCQVIHHDFSRGYGCSLEDSLMIWQKGWHKVTVVSTAYQQRFQTILDSLLRPHMMSSKSGIVFPQAQHLLDSSHAAHLEHFKSGMRSPRAADTLQAMQILLAEKRR